VGEIVLRETRDGRRYTPQWKKSTGFVKRGKEKKMGVFLRGKNYESPAQG